MSGYDADTSSESECGTLDYDLVRLRKMQRNYELLKRLGLVTPTTPTKTPATPPNLDDLQHSRSDSQNSPAISPTLFQWHDHHRRPAWSSFFIKKSSPKRQTLKSKTTRDFLVNRKSARLSRKPRVSYSEFHRNRFDSQESLPQQSSSTNDDQSGQPETAILGSPDQTPPDNSISIVSRRVRPAGVFVQGSRVYDPVNGITCHQCRQKTIEKKTQCSRCHKGHLCSRCLQNRYGEVFEQVQQNPNWICPQCRGICNCSTCLNKQGRSAVGMLIAEVHDRGYNSVAEMLAAQPGPHHRHTRVPPQSSSTASTTTELDIDADDEASDNFKSNPTPHG